MFLWLFFEMFNAVLKPLDRLINDTIEYTRQRQIFGQSVLDHQVVHFRLAELATEVESLRALIYRSVGKFNISLIYKLVSHLTSVRVKVKFHRHSSRWSVLFHWCLGCVTEFNQVIFCLVSPIDTLVWESIYFDNCACNCLLWLLLLLLSSYVSSARARQRNSTLSVS